MASEEDIKGAFDLFDKTNSGTISATDAGTAIRTLGKAPSEEELKEIISGNLDYATFKAAFEKCESVATEDVFEAFSTFDTNGNGYIPLKELLHLMKNLGEGLSDEQLNKLKVVCEPDSDDQVNYRHFIDLMMKDI